MVLRTDGGPAPVSVTRYDVGTPLDKWERTPTGGIRLPAKPTRSGVFPYRQTDGTVRLEYRPPDEVFHPDSLATLSDVPVTDLHPEANGVRIPVTPENWKALTVGHVAPGAQRDGSHVSATVMIQDQAMIQKVLAGDRKELSCGYTCQLDMTPGVTPDGERFDATQAVIRYNHLAVGPAGWGRAGPSVALRADSAEQTTIERDRTVKETINGVEYVVGSGEHIAALKGQRDQALGRADAADKALVTAKAAAPDPAVIRKAAGERARLLVLCHQAAASRQVIFDDAAAEPMSNDDLIAQIIIMLDPDADVKGKSPDYLAGVLTTLAKALKAGAPTDDAKTNPDTPTAPGPMAGNPPGPGQPTQKTDATSPLFKARAGDPATVKTDTKVDPEEAARYDSDLAAAALAKSNSGRAGKPLRISAVRVTG